MNYEEYQRKLEEFEYQKFLFEKDNKCILSKKHFETCQQDFDFFSKTFKDIGFIGYLKAIDNPYWPKAYEVSQQPWYEHHSEFGVITVGWRKRVISISWDPKIVNRVSGERDFNIRINTSDNVTHMYEVDRAVIHAWSEEKFTEYLKLLYASMNKYGKEAYICKYRTHNC